MTPSNLLKRSRAATIETPIVDEPAQKRQQVSNLNQSKTPSEYEYAVVPRTKWTDEMVRLLLEYLVEARKAGQGRSTGTFELSTFSGALPKLQPHGKKPITESQCSSKLEHIRGIWREWGVHLKAVSGWTWNKEKGVPESDPTVMDRYFAIRAHNGRKRFRHAPPPHKNMMEFLFGAVTSGQSLQSRQETVNSDSVKSRVLTWLQSSSESSFIKDSEIPAPWSPSPEPEDPQSDETGSIDSEALSSEASEDSEYSVDSGDSEFSEDSAFSDESFTESVAEALSESINGLLEVLSSMIGQVVELFTDSQTKSSASSVNLAMATVSAGFPNISSGDKLLIFGQFELFSVKADIFMALNESTREVWLNHLLRTLRS